MKNKLAKRFSAFLANLPDEELLKLSNDAQKAAWHESRQRNVVLSSCFHSRLCGGDDPIVEWKEQKELLLAYKMYWTYVEMFESLWGLVQLTFSDIHKTFEEIPERTYISYVFPFTGAYVFHFTGAWDLFLEIVKVQENLAFSNLLKPSYKSVDPKRDKRMVELSRKNIWSGLTEEEEIELDKLSEHFNFNFWKNIVHVACYDISKSDPLIAAKYKYYRSLVGEFSDLAIKMYSDAAKGRNGLKIKSKWWIDGQLYVGQKKGGKYSLTSS